jgi:hypothetical protein
MEFEDTQSAMYLLRISFGIIRANHFMRTTPSDQWSPQALKFDEIMRTATETIIGAPFTAEAYDQACVSPRVGGLGMRRASDHATVAFAASFLSSSLQCGETWIRPSCVPESAVGLQSLGSTQVDAAILDKLTQNADARNKQRLRRLDCKHANAWVTALPSVTDGRDTIMEPQIFRTAVYRLLGLPVFPQSLPCPLCKQTMDIMGDHALCCKKTSDLVTRHNRLRGWVYRIADVGRLSPELEKLGILGPTDENKRRPGDVSIPLWSCNKGLAIDVAVVCPVAASHLNQEEPCEWYAAHQKHRLYDRGFVGSRYDFAALVFESSGAVNSEGESVLKQLIRFAAKREKAGNSSYAGRAWARVSCCIQISVAQSILNRDHAEIPGPIDD